MKMSEHSLYSYIFTNVPRNVYMYLDKHIALFPFNYDCHKNDST